jgi:hypothetical protein
MTTKSAVYQRRRPTRSPVRAIAIDASANAGEQCREDDPDLEAGEPAAGERDADEDAAEPIGERP